jgi:hypothetical protein
MLTMACPPAEPTALIPLPPLSRMTLTVMSTVTGPLVVSIFMPPPVLSAMVTWSNWTDRLPPAAGLRRIAAPPLSKTQFLTISRDGDEGWALISFTMAPMKWTFSRIRVPFTRKISLLVFSPM